MPVKWAISFSSSTSTSRERTTHQCEVTFNEKMRGFCRIQFQCLRLEHFAWNPSEQQMYAPLKPPSATSGWVHRPDQVHPFLKNLEKQHQNTKYHDPKSWQNSPQLMAFLTDHQNTVVGTNNFGRVRLRNLRGYLWPECVRDPFKDHCVSAPRATQVPLVLHRGHEPIGQSLKSVSDKMTN